MNILHSAGTLDNCATITSGVRLSDGANMESDVRRQASIDGNKGYESHVVEAFHQAKK